MALKRKGVAKLRRYMSNREAARHFRVRLKRVVLRALKRPPKRSD